MVRNLMHSAIVRFGFKPGCYRTATLPIVESALLSMDHR
jgi:hypothetical protein